MKTIKNIAGRTIEVTNLNAAIRQCRLCLKSSFKMDSGHTVGENHTFMLEQLERIKKEQSIMRTD